MRALAKLQQVLPSRLRRKVSAFQSYVLPAPSGGPQADPDVLTAIASACRDHERLRFDYQAHSGAASRRSVEPYRQGRLPIPVTVESLGEDQCAFEPGSDHPEMLALYLGMLDADFSIADSPELVEALRKLASRYQRAIDSSQQAPGWLYRTGAVRAPGRSPVPLGSRAQLGRLVRERRSN